MALLRFGCEADDGCSVLGYRGGHNPSYMYRLIADYYSADDLVM